MLVPPDEVHGILVTKGELTKARLMSIFGFALSVGVFFAGWFSTGFYFTF